MATIQKRGDLQWRAMVRRKGYPTQSGTFTTRASAEAWARKVEREIETGRWRDTSEADRTTIGEALDRYIRTIAPRKKGKGLHNNRSQANIIKRHPIAKISLSRVRVADVSDYRDKRSEEVSANTVRLELALLSHVFTVAAAEWGMEGVGNPVKLARKPSLQGTQRDRRLVGNEESRLLQAAQAAPTYMYPVIFLALETGMRRGEIVAVRWEHVDLARRVIHLPETKNGEARDVPLSRKAIAVLQGMKKVQRMDGRLFGIEKGQVSRQFSSLCKAAVDSNGNPEPIEDLHFHDLRHEATSRLFEKGLNPMQVAAITGHKTLQMLKRYTHLKAEDLAMMLD